MESLSRNQNLLLRIVSSSMIILGYYHPWRYWYIPYTGAKEIYGFNEAGEITLALGILALISTIVNIQFREKSELTKIVSISAVVSTVVISYKTVQYLTWDYEASGHRLILGNGFYMTWIGCLLLLYSSRDNILASV